jgi:hypothetical protein
MCDALGRTDPRRGSSEENSVSQGWRRREVLRSVAPIPGGVAAGSLVGVSPAPAQTQPVSAAGSRLRQRGVSKKLGVGRGWPASNGA